MRNSYFQFKQFTIHQDRCAMKVTTDACLFGAWVAEELRKDVSLHNKSTHKLLDIGTGTGLLPLMIAQKNEDIRCEAIEMDAAAFAQATENATASPWKDKIQIHHGDVNRFSFNKQYDSIVSNPPFYENELQSPDTSKNKAHHSSDLTLQQLFTTSFQLLKEDGIFFFLLPYKRSKEIGRLMNESGLCIHEKVLVKQSLQHDYFRILIKGSKQEIKQTKGKEIAICTTPPHYTSEFITLLKDYYLHL